MNSTDETAKRCRLWQFNLSTLLLLTTLVAVASGWWLDRRQLTDQRRTAEVVSRELKVLNAEKLRGREMELLRMRLAVNQLRLELSYKESMEWEASHAKQLHENERELVRLDSAVRQLRSELSSNEITAERAIEGFANRLKAD